MWDRTYVNHVLTIVCDPYGNVYECWSLRVRRFLALILLLHTESFAAKRLFEFAVVFLSNYMNRLFLNVL
jgi:hypothetical protein